MAAKPNYQIKPVTNPVYVQGTGNVLIASDSALGPIVFTPFDQSVSPYMRIVGYISVGQGHDLEGHLAKTREFTYRGVTYAGYLTVGIDMNYVWSVVSSRERGQKIDRKVEDIFNFGFERVYRVGTGSSSDVTNSAKERLGQIATEALKWTTYEWWKQGDPSVSTRNLIDTQSRSLDRDISAFLSRHYDRDVLNNVPIEPYAVQHFMQSAYKVLRTRLLESFDSRFTELIEKWSSADVYAGQDPYAKRIREFINDELDLFRNGGNGGGV